MSKSTLAHRMERLEDITNIYAGHVPRVLTKTQQKLVDRYVRQIVEGKTPSAELRKQIRALDLDRDIGQGVRDIVEKTLAFDPGPRSRKKTAEKKPAPAPPAPERKLVRIRFL